MIRLYLLGAIDLRIENGAELRPVLAQPKRLALLAYLAANAHHGPSRRDRLLALFWPERDHEHARNALSKAVHFLRRSIGEQALVSRGAEQLTIDTALVWSDVVAFGSALDAGRLDEALELYRGDLLPGLFVHDAPGFEEWLERERATLRSRAANAARLLSERHEAEGNVTGALDRLRCALELSDVDERMVRRLVGLLYRLGDRAGAVRVYEQFAGRLSAELEVDPSAETQALVEQVRAGTLARDDPPPMAPSPMLDAPREAQDSNRSIGTMPLESAASPVAERTAGRRFRVAAWVAASLLVLIIGATVWRVIVAPPRGGGATEVVAVLPFTVRGSADLSYLREGMVELLGMNLDGAPGQRSANPHVVLGLVSRRPGVADEPGGARSIARELGASAFVLGTVVALGRRVRMNATLYPVAGGRDTIAASVEGDVTEVAHLVDRLTAQLLVGRSRGADARFASLAATTTSSLPALKAYLDGERRWRMRQLDSAVAAFGHAVEYDTAFALAYYRMAVAGSYRFTSPPDAAARALRHSARLPERYRLLVEAFSARDRGAVFEAESLYRKVLASHPDDAEAWFTLAALTHRRLFAHGRPIHAAREAFERVLALEPTHPRALGGLAILDGYEGKHERAVGRMRRILRVDHGEYNVLFRTALALHDGDRADQQRALAELSRSKEDWILLGAGWAGVVTGNRQGGVQVARLVAAHARAPRWRVDALFCIADLELAHGRRSAASAASTEAARIAPLFALHARTALALVPSLESSAADLVDLRQEVMKTRPAERSESLWRTYLLGLLDSRIGNRDAALRSADDLESQSTPLTRADSGSHAAMARDLALTIRADVSWRSGHPRQALAFLARNRRSSWGAARPSAAWVLNGGLAPGYAEPSAYERWMRGELAASVGRPREAIDWFDGLGAAWPGEGMSYFAPSRLRMGALYEGLGEPERAAEQYERVIELWKDADPDLKLVVTEAKKRLTLLVAKSSP